MFLVDMTFTEPQLITAELTARHRAHLEQEYLAGRLMFGGRKLPRTGGILISMHESRQQLTAILEADPFVASGLVRYAITEFEPVMAAAAYSQLLAG
jgi:uncharacterized protein YciI